jgi:chorismate-pyruvate lyase
MRRSIQKILEAQGASYFDLPLFARLLLVTDGTVTELLEALVKEPVLLGYKNQLVDDAKKYSDVPQTNNSKCLIREITLKGETSQQDWLYAESVVFHQSFGKEAQMMLLDDNTPIGSILNQHAADNHRKIIDCGFSKNTNAAKHLNILPDYSFLFRKYAILIKSTTIIVITEWFPIDRISAQAQVGKF